MVIESLDPLYSLEIMGNQIGLSAIVYSIVFVLTGFVLARIARTIFTRKFAPNMPEHTSKNVGKFIYYGIIAISLLIVITSTGIDLSGLLVAGGIFGVVIGFATQSIVSNLISGFFLMAEKPLKQIESVFS